MNRAGGLSTTLQETQIYFDFARSHGDIKMRKKVIAGQSGDSSLCCHILLRSWGIRTQRSFGTNWHSFSWFYKHSFISVLFDLHFTIRCIRSAVFGKRMLQALQSPFPVFPVRVELGGDVPGCFLRVGRGFVHKTTNHSLFNIGKVKRKQLCKYKFQKSYHLAWSRKCCTWNSDVYRHCKTLASHSLQ